MKFKKYLSASLVTALLVASLSLFATNAAASGYGEAAIEEFSVCSGECGCADVAETEPKEIQEEPEENIFIWLWEQIFG